MGHRLYVCGQSMKPGKLYIKIFLSFLVILLITEIIIFMIFLAVPGKYFRTRFEQYTQAKVLMVKEVIQDKIKAKPDIPLPENGPLNEFINNFGEILGAKVWLQGIDGSLSVKSFAGRVPRPSKRLKRVKSLNFEGFKLFHRRHMEFYAIIPIAFPKGEKGNIHVLFDRQRHTHPERGFALGLAIIGLIIALLVIPISRFITKPLKELNQSALRIAEGDLSNRVVVKCKDEIGELCASFNHMADRVERMIMGGRELTANVSHELRTPLARIRIAEQLLREKLERKESNGLDRHLDDIREDILELDRLIGQILDLSKLDIQESPLNFEQFDPKDLINELLGRIKPRVDRKGLRMETALLFDPPFHGDRDALNSVFSNILDNAVKFTPEDGSISIEMLTDDDMLVVSVTNTFDPLPESDRLNLFEPFYRTEGNRVEGSGLGLAIAKKIIEKHGGSIEAINAERGLCIRMVLPAGSRSH